MLRKVKEWQPPTIEHIGLKDFMIQQIEGSIKFDDMLDYYHDHPIIKLNFEQWKYNKIEELKKDEQYYMNSWKEETIRTAGRNKWLQHLRDSLK